MSEPAKQVKDGFFKQKAAGLLEELPNLGPTELEEWNIEAQTLLTFAAMDQFCRTGEI